VGRPGAVESARQLPLGRGRGGRGGVLQLNPLGRLLPEAVSELVDVAQLGALEGAGPQDLLQGVRVDHLSDEQRRSSLMQGNSKPAWRRGEAKLRDLVFIKVTRLPANPRQSNSARRKGEATLGDSGLIKVTRLLVN